MQPWSQPLLWKGGTGGTPGDPYWSYVVLLLGFEGTNGAATGPGFTDESPTLKGLASNINNTTITNAQLKFGATSAVFTGSSSGITWNDSNDFNLGAGLFTIEMWVRFNSVASQSFLAAQYQAGSDAGWVFFVNPSQLCWSLSTTGSDYHALIAAPWGPATGTWYHVAVDFDGTKTRVYANGVMLGSSTSLFTIHDSSQLMSIGSDAGRGTNNYNGWMDEVRITKGVARYATDTSFAVPTAAFPRHA